MRVAITENFALWIRALKKTSLGADDDKHYLNCKIPADNLRSHSTLKIIKSSANTIARVECEKSNDSTFKARKRIIEGLFSLVGNELFLAFLELCIGRDYWAWLLVVLLTMVDTHACRTAKRCT